jgi:hypothetical protein
MNFRWTNLNHYLLPNKLCCNTHPRNPSHSHKHMNTGSSQWLTILSVKLLMKFNKITQCLLHGLNFINIHTHVGNAKRIPVGTQMWIHPTDNGAQADETFLSDKKSCIRCAYTDAITLPTYTCMIHNSSEPCQPAQCYSFVLWRMCWQGMYQIDLTPAKLYLVLL